MPSPDRAAQTGDRTEQTAGRYAASVQQALELKDQADTNALRRAIEQYRAMQGRFPESLEVLPEVRDQGMDTSRWAYDPATGKVALAPGNLAEAARLQAGEAAAAADSPVEAVRRALQVKDMSDWKAMKVATNVYQAEQGRFPEHLEDLPIVRERGIDPGRWVYEAATGKVYLHPGFPSRKSLD